MNERADDFIVTLRGIFGMLPGARSFSFHAFEVWAIALITASSDEAVIALSEDFELGKVAIRTTPDRWWRYASVDRDQGRVRIVVAGPHHMGSPPQDEGALSSSG